MKKRESKPPTRITALDKIRKQYTAMVTRKWAVNQPLNDDSLQKAWKDYITELRKINHPAVQSFERSTLRIKDENCFEAITTNNIEQKFIEQERNKLFHFLHQQLQNRVLQFTVIIEGITEANPAKEVSLTAREQYQKMAEMYPLVKELKEKLRLELDY
jgi:DNA polymerase-3 subunit gamma/tau